MSGIEINLKPGGELEPPRPERCGEGSGLSHAWINRLYDGLLRKKDVREADFWRGMFGDKAARFRREGVTDWDVERTRRYYKSLYRDVQGFLGVENFDGRRVMELGCGSGILTLLMACHGATVFLVDVLEEALDCARGVEQRLREAFPFRGSVRYIQASFWEPPDCGPLDLVHNEGVLEEMSREDAARLVGVMADLSAGGVMVGVPNFFNPYLIRLWLQYGKTTELYYDRAHLARLLTPILGDVRTMSSSLVYPSLTDLPLASRLGRAGLGFLHLGYGTVKKPV